MRIKLRTLPQQLPNLGSLPDILSKIFAARGVTDASELEHSFKFLLPYQQLKGIESAVNRLVEALASNQRILVVGDFDADGATATAVAILGLKMLGAQHVDYLVPNRFDFGYGLTPEIVELAKERKPNLIVTVDNGISSVAGVLAAQRDGIDVLITDHHLPGNDVPDAVAIVNPNQHGCSFPSKSMAGVGVIFYVLLALRAQLRQMGRLQNGEPNLATLLDLVALGTVADVVALDVNNRILVQQGLARIRAGHLRPGLAALIAISGRNPSALGANDLGFAVGPRLNAAGRLDDMSLGIECLLAENIEQASSIAARLEQLNQQRKSIESQMQTSALEQLENLNLVNLPLGLCVFEQDWHQGVLGILASRLRERYHRPVIAFACTGDGQLKGSARSVAGLHIRDTLDAIAASHPHLLKRFGGHAMAAGLSIEEQHYSEFSAIFDEQVRKLLDESDLQLLWHSDGELEDKDFELGFARDLRLISPWGQGFPEPGFHGNFRILQQRLVGEKHLKLVLQPSEGSKVVDAIAFNVDLDLWPNPNIKTADIAYRLDVNEFRGQQSLQLLVEHLQPSS